MVIKSRDTRYEEIIGQKAEINQQYLRTKFNGFLYAMPKDLSDEGITLTGDLLEVVLKSDLLPQD